MRGTLLAATAVVVLTAVAGCGGEVDTTKVTYTRTTVPAGAADSTGRTETGRPRANDPAFTIDKLRLIEPCELLTDDLLESVGKPAENARGNFGECANYMKDAEGEDLSITLNVGGGVTNAADAEQNIGGLPAMESELDSGDACFVTVVTSTSPNFGLVIQAGGSAKDLCAAGRTVMAGVVEAIRADPPEYDTARGTLLTVDPCAALDEAVLTAALGAGDDGAPYNLHWCNWSGDSASLGLWFRLGFDPKQAGSDAKPVDLGGGITGYQEATTSADVASCELQYAHRPFDGEDTEIVHLFFDKSEPAKDEDPCAATQTLAKELIATLPKP